MGIADGRLDHFFDLSDEEPLLYTVKKMADNIRLSGMDNE